MTFPDGQLDVSRRRDNGADGWGDNDDGKITVREKLPMQVPKHRKNITERGCGGGRSASPPDALVVFAFGVEFLFLEGGWATSKRKKTGGGWGEGACTLDAWGNGTTPRSLRQRRNLACKAADSRCGARLRLVVR